MPDQSRHTVKDPEMIKLLNQIGERLGASIPESWGFIFFMFEFGDKKDMFYISSADREDVINVLDEWKRMQRQ